MSDCIFCRIVSGEIPSRKIYEDEDILAFLDIQPISRGHLLVIPKEHCDDLSGLPDRLISPLFLTVRRLSAAVTKALKADGMNVITNKGFAAGQLIFHAHVHVIPRFTGDGLTSWPKISLTDAEMDDIATTIREKFN